jgi:hypothetical protein
VDKARGQSARQMRIISDISNRRMVLRKCEKERGDNMTNEKAIMCLEDMRIKVPIPKAAKQARENNEALDVAIKALKNEPHWIPVDLENNKPQLEEWVLVSSDGYVMQDCIVKRGGEKIWYHGGNIQDDDRYKPLPEPYKPTVPPECEGDCGWCKPTVIEKCKGVTT